MDFREFWVSYSDMLICRWSLKVRDNLPNRTPAGLPSFTLVQPLMSHAPTSSLA